MPLHLEVWEQAIATQAGEFYRLMNSCLTMMSDDEARCSETEESDCE